MSARGENQIEISLEPRMDFDRTRSTPGTRLTASSIGRVTPKTSWRAPKEEPCATTTTRGKASSG